MDMKQDISAKECVNCPGATDHDTAHCPIKPQAIAAQSAPDAHERWLSDPNNEPFPGGLSGIPVPALQSAPDEREAFEAAIRHSYPRNHYLYLTRKADGYENPYISIRWDGFQAGAAWQRAQSAAGVPEGWRLVPVEATDDMLDAFQNFGGPSAHDAYKAMLAAAPQPAAQELCNCPGGNKPEPHKHAPNCPYRAGAAARQDQGDEVRRLREALERAETYVQTAFSRAQAKDRLGRKLPADHPISVDLALVQAALSAQQMEGK